MKFKLHNEVVIKTGNESFIFHNNIFNNVYKKIAELEPYFSYLAIGTGTNYIEENNSYFLSDQKSIINLETENLQSDITKTNLYSKKSCIIDSLELDGKYITEMGIASESKENAEVFNYFNLISDETPNGILKSNGEPILITICIYLELQNTANLTLGQNPLIELLLGEGTKNKKIFAVRGNNLCKSDNIHRLLPTGEKYLATISSTIAENLTLNFEFDLQCNETNEIVLVIDERAFLRILVNEHNETTTETISSVAGRHFTVDAGENAKNIISVKNLSTQESETSYNCRPYATDFADQISLPFYDMFDSDTPRYLSKDGKRIYFIIDDHIYAYENKDYEVYQLKTYDLHIQNIQKLVAFDDYFVVLTKQSPYIQAYKLNKTELLEISVDLSNYSLKNSLSTAFDFDATLAKNGLFMIGILFAETLTGSTIYYDFDETNLTLTYTQEHLFENYQISHVLAMYKNNYSDALIMFLKGGEYSYETKIITCYPDKTYSNVYSVLGYYYTKDAKSVYTKNRAVVVEKTTSPSLWIYFYPQVYRYYLPLLNDEVDNYLSTNLLYLIQQYKSGEFKIFSLVDFDNPNEFSHNFPSEIDMSKIVDFEFLEDTLLIFQNTKTNKIIGYNLKTNNMLLENVSSDNATYEIIKEKYNPIGLNNEGVIVRFALTVTI